MKFELYRFGDLVVNFDRKRIPLSAKERANRQGKYRYYGAQGVIDYVDDYLFDGRYILIAEDGENLSSQKQNIAQIVEGKFWVNNHAHIVQCNEKCRLDYLEYAINSMDLSGYITGSAQPKLSQNNLNAVEIALPDLETQDAIISVIKPIDSKIEVNRAINHNLEQQAFALFDYLFPNISDGLCTIGDYITPKRGRNLLSKDAVPGTVPVVAGGLEPSTYHNIANTLAPVLTISASGANAGFVNLWHKPVWSSDSSFIDSSMTKDVYFWFVMLKKRQREIFDAQTGSAQPHIYPQHIAAMTIRSLDQALMSNFTSQVTPLFALIGANKDENDRLTSVRDALLPKLISGEIDVSEIEV